MKNKTIISLLIFSMCLASCQTAVESTGTAVNEGSVQSEGAAKTLTICMGYEPESLYPYAAVSQAAQDVLQAIYDGPVDIIDGQANAVILESIPNFSDGSAQSTAIDVQAGDKVINIYGKATRLQTGEQIYPSGCTDISCAITWDGTSELHMDQLTAAFYLLPGLVWSDGQALTAADSVYSFSLASDAATPIDKAYVNQTAGYNALNETAVEWISLPGLVTDEFENYFWMPLPQHAWGAYSAVELLGVEEAARSPLGWGPYVMDEWSPGEYIRLKKNELYFRADEGLPKYDYLIFKITNAYGDTNIANLKFEREPYAQFNYDLGDFEGEINQNGCDLTSTTADMSDQLEVLNTLKNYFSTSAVKVFEGKRKQVEWLLFNQREREDGQAAIFSDPDMRQALSFCLEREELAKTNFYNLVNVPNAFSFTYEDAGAEMLFGSDPANGQELLTKNGWVDENSKDELPRRAQNVTGIADGTELSINYLVKDDNLSLAAANQVKSSLTECGFQVNIIAVSPEVYWDSNSTKSIFQGNYHIAQLGWELPIENPCPLFESGNIPAESNDYQGLNFSGFSNSKVDELCGQIGAMNLAADKQSRLETIEAIINEELAVIPLYTSADLMAARSDFCTASTSSAQSELAQIESFAYGESCMP